MPRYRFYTRSKVRKGYNGFAVGFADEASATGFCDAVNAQLANNGKLGCIQSVRTPSQQDIELPSGQTNLETCVRATYLLLAEDNSGVVLAKSFVSIAGLKPNHAHIDFSGAQLTDAAGTAHDVTKVVHVSDKYVDVSGAELDGEASGTVDGNYTNENAWQAAAGV